jgi:zinc protease
MTARLRLTATLLASVSLGACHTPRTFQDRPANTSAVAATLQHDASLDAAAHEDPGAPKDTVSTRPSPRLQVLRNGMRVVVLRRLGVPMVTIELSYGAGYDDDTTGVSLLAAFFWANQEDFGFAYPRLAATEGRRVGATRTRLLAHAPANSLGGVLAHYASMIADPQPVFPFLDFSIPRRVVGGELRRELAEPKRRAHMALDELLGHPEPELNEQLTRVQRLDRDDATAFLQSHVRPSDVMLVVVGDIAEDRTLALVDRLYGGIQATSAAPPAAPLLPGPAPLSRTPVLVVDHPGDVQTTISMGAVLPPTTAVNELEDADALAAIVGGTVTARASQLTRLRDGKTYGTSAFTWKRRWGRIFVVESSVETSDTASSVLAMQAAVRSAREEAPTTAEIEMARTRAFGPHAVSADSLAEWLTGWADYDEPFDTFVDRTSRNTGRERAKVQAVASSYLGDDKLRVVLVGDASKIVPQLRAANIGPFEVRK